MKNYRTIDRLYNSIKKYCETKHLDKHFRSKEIELNNEQEIDTSEHSSNDEFSNIYPYNIYRKWSDTLWIKSILFLFWLYEMASPLEQKKKSY